MIRWIENQWIIIFSSPADDCYLYELLARVVVYSMLPRLAASQMKCLEMINCPTTLSLILWLFIWCHHETDKLPLTFGIDIHIPLRMECNNFVDALTFHSASQTFNLSNTWIDACKTTTDVTFTKLENQYWMAVIFRALRAHCIKNRHDVVDITTWAEEDFQHS